MPCVIVDFHTHIFPAWLRERRDEYVKRDACFCSLYSEPKAKMATAEELVADEMPRITEALELNDFEQAVVSSILTKYVQQRIELQILKLPKDQTLAALEKIAENQNLELKQGLPADKYEAFVELQENGYKGKKKRKKKKKQKT